MLVCLDEFVVKFWIVVLYEWGGFGFDIIEWEKICCCVLVLVEFIEVLVIEGGIDCVRGCCCNL